MRTRNTFYNSVSGIIYYLVNVFFGLISRKIIIIYLGIEYQGINGLFNNILSLLSIAELGIGTTIVYHLYKPFYEHDNSMIKPIISFYKKCYIVIALIITILGIAVIPFLPHLIKDFDIPYSLSTIFLLYLSDTVFSYLFTHKRSLLIADQKNYLVNIFDIAYQIFTKISQIFIIITTRNFIYYLVIAATFRLIENFILNLVINKKYAFIDSKNMDSLDNKILSDIKKKVRGTFLHKIGTFIVLGTDNIIISKFIGLTAVGIYSNYYLIINVINNIFSQVISSATASIGSMLNEQNEKKNCDIFEQLQLVNAALVNTGSVSLYFLSTPFITWFFGDNYSLSNTVLLVLSLNFYVTGMRKVYVVFKEAAGVLYEDSFIPLVESILNITLSIILVKFLGMTGVFIGTILSSMILYCYTYPILVYKKILKRKLNEYVKQLINFIGILFLSFVCTEFVVKQIECTNIYFMFFLTAIVCLTVPSILFYLLYAKKNSAFVLLKQRLKVSRKNMPLVK
ncbi:oligosaccharide flippase family protein [Enterocloster aldenensis]|uniref:lipopolysaccharide biosynthesis protein n=1 Tax=Enterocloster aldenensis TaxID=358742 RepID=UPI001D097F67|nr:oligosaccharide flippase family protein [Enterocloster aldenensis]